MINALSLFLLLSSLATILLGVWVWRINPKNEVYLRWCLFCVCIAIWSLGLGVLTTVRDQKVANIFYLIHYFGAAPIPITFLHFIHVYFLKETKLTFDLAIGYFLVITQYLLFLTGQMVAPLTPKWEFTYYANPGPYYLFFVIYFFAYVFYCFYLMFKATLTEKQSERKKGFFFIVATGLGYLCGSTTFLLVYDLPCPPYGIYIFLLFPIITTYAIVRHHLMDIEVLIRRTVVFTGLFVFVFSIIGAINFVLQILLVRVVNVSNSMSLGIGIAILLFLHDPVKGFLITLTDRFLFQKKYDSRQVLTEFADEVITKLNLSEIVNSTLELLANHVRIEICAIFLLNTFADRYESYGSRGMGDGELLVPSNDPFIQLLKKRKDYVLKSDSGVSELVMPFFIHDELIGFLALGKKKSDEEYTQEDLDTLSVLARTVTIAISNARMSAQAAENEKRAAIGTLAAGINHEIRNPLNIMKTKIDAYTLKLDKGLFGNQTPEELVQIARKIMEVCNSQIERIAGITEKLSNFAKPSKELKPTEVHIADELKETLEFLEHELELDQIRLQVDIPPSLPAILADKNQMRQIFFNIIRNAAQAIEGSGQIAISAKTTGNGKIQIDISDTGCGIASDKLDKIFVPFYTTKEPGKGTGLGLSVVRQLVWSNQGEISVKSKVGEGTTFTLEFPIIKG